MGLKQCEVCKDAQSKYKCPSCLLPYCSLLCFKKHKEIPCEKPVPSETKPYPMVLPERIYQVDEPKQLLQQAQLESIDPMVLPERTYQVDEPKQLLQQAQLESIAASDEVRNALKDEELQKLISMIDSSTDAENELAKAMEMEGFHNFTEKEIDVYRDEDDVIYI